MLRLTCNVSVHFPISNIFIEFHRMHFHMIFFLILVDPATVDTPFSWIMIGEGELANMECAIDANPLEASMVQWTHESTEKMSQLGNRAERAFQDNKSYLTIKNVTANDAGLYHCTVNNGIGEATNRSIFLIVKRKHTSKHTRTYKQANHSSISNLYKWPKLNKLLLFSLR